MRLIAHRGNLQGPDPMNENQPFYLELALKNGFDIEFDIRFCDGQLFLGHDAPEYPLHIEELEEWYQNFPEREFYVHCKNIDALDYFSNDWDTNGNPQPRLIPFFHYVDDAILLKNNKIWVHPLRVYDFVDASSDKTKFIFVAPNLKHVIHYQAYGICSDYVGRIK